MRDLEYAFRVLLKTPGFTVVTVLSLGVSIGASTALLSVVDAVLLRMLPVRQPGRLVTVHLGGWGDSASYRSFEVLRNGSGTVLDGLAAYATRPLTLAGTGSPERILGGFVSGEFFPTLGVTPILGRGLTPQDDRDAAAGGVVVSGAFWQRRLGTDPAVLGQTLRINGRAFPVVGVAPPGFFGMEVGRAVDVYLPVTAAAEIGAIDAGMMTGYFSTWLRLIGRLAPGTDERHAAARLTVLLHEYLRTAAGELDRASGASGERRQRLLSWQASLQPAGRGYGAILRSRLTAQLVAAGVLAGLVLLLVAANVGSLLLARAVARRREVAIRLSLGATRGQIGRHVLTESALLAMTGAFGGVLLAPVLASVVIRQLPADFGPVSLDVSLNWRVLGAATALCIFATLLTSLAALIHSTRQPPAAIKIAAAGVTERVRIGPQRALVVIQVAVCVVVLIVAALFVQTLRNLGRIDLGISAGHVLIGSIDPSSVGYAHADLQQLYRTIQDRLVRLPEVTSGSLMIGQPFLLRRGSDVEIQGRRINLRWEVVAPRFFETMGMSLTAGRDFTAGDTLSAPFAGIVNETLAQQYFPGRNPVGEYILRFVTKDGVTGRAPMQIVGIVRDVIHRTPRDHARPVLYAPAAQETFALSPASLVVRSALPPLRLVPAVRQAVSQIDPNLALFDVKTFEHQIQETIWAERLLSHVASGFGLTALTLAGLGLFGTLSHAVTRRAREIAVRIAIGANPRAIRNSVVGDGVLLCGAGALIGLPIAFAASRYLTGLLYGIEPGDWRPVAVAGLLLAGMALLAAYLPARRASRVDPMPVLRAE